MLCAVVLLTGVKRKRLSVINASANRDGEVEPVSVEVVPGGGATSLDGDISFELHHNKLVTNKPTSVGA